MVTNCFAVRRANVLVLVLALLSAPMLRAKELSQYKIGDRAEEDITTPAALVVVDAEATAALKEKEGERVPVVFRFNPNAAEEASASFHDSFIKTRGKFLDAVEQTFNERKLDSETIASARFTRVVTTFQKQNPLFPVSTDLGRIWASGESDETYEKPFIAALHQQMQLFIRSTNSVSAGAKVGSTVRVVWCGDNDTVTEQMVARHGTNCPKGDFVSFQRARTDLVDGFPPEQRAAANYLRSFLKPNCFVEEELTIILRAKRTEGLTSADTYSAGQLIVKRGQVIDARTLAAIAALREKMPVVAAVSPVKDAPLGKTKMFLVIAAAVVAVLIFGVVLGAFLRARAAASLLPVPTSSAPVGSPGSLAEKEWQQRAIVAERRAEKAQAVIRKGLIAHLAGWMSDALVQRLLLQRAQLIDAQQKAVTEVDRLGQRLDTIQTRLQTRLLAYEQRIAELEKELDSKDEINRELIKAEIETIRRQMEAERAKGEGALN